MKRVGLLVLVFVLVAPAARGQVQQCTDRLEAGTDSVPLNLASNEVEVVAAAGDSLWAGPLQGVYCKPEGERPKLIEINTLESELGGNGVSAIATRNGTPQGDLVWAGLSFDTGDGELGTNGFLVSNDGGRSFERRSPQPQIDQPTDTTISYGVSTVSAAPITQRASSTPQDIAFGPDGDTVWVAGRRSGIRWTADGGTTWARTVLPSNNSPSTDPSTPTDVFVSPPLDDGRGSLNHLGLSVLVDETGTVWAGTGGGLNRARPEGVAADDSSRAWQRFTADDPDEGPPGESVVALAEQPRPSARNPIWVASLAVLQQQEGRRQRSGVAVTEDGGTSFRQTLIGERISDLAAREARVYAVGSTGVFVTADQGRSWQSVERFPLQNDSQTLPSDLDAQTVTVTPSALWVGTTAGLLRLDRDDEPALLSGRPKWQLFRTETPVNPESPSEEAPDVSTYAYPNPFVPSRDEFVRITYELEQARTVEVNIYDFGMNQVKTLTDQQPPGQQETVWRGTDKRGLRVPTGTYFYTVDLGGRTVEGKIILAN